MCSPKPATDPNPEPRSHVLNHIALQIYFNDDDDDDDDINGARLRL
jgi:hypothetical protein